ncbi:hypothetical protein L2E81_21515 [Planktothrix agardhii 1033]|nr:hypothetical protein [Planktothrix agardhii 1033]
MNSIRNKVIKILNDCWREERDTWESPDGKKIPFIRFSKFIFPGNDDMNSYHIAITIWSKNISIEIIQSCSEHDSEQWATTKIHRIAKVSKLKA